MAVSFKIIVTLFALAAFSLGFIALDKPMQDTVTPLTEDNMESQAAQTGHDRFQQGWNLLPVIATIAGVSYLLKESVFQSGRY